MSLPPEMFYGKKAIIDTDNCTSLASCSDTDSDLSSNDNEIEEVEELVSDGLDSELDSDSSDRMSDDDEGSDDVVTGRDNCTLWYNEPPRTRRIVRQNVIRE